MSVPLLAPVCISDAEFGQWAERSPMLLRFARFWATYGPRGKGYVPRMIGRLFGRHWKTVVRTQDGELLAVDTLNLDIYTTILRDGAWEPWILNACLAALRPSQVFYDIG